MIKVIYETRFSKPHTSYYDYRHNAVTILLLAGYLPLQEDGKEVEDTFINTYTRETARIERI